MSKNNKNIVNFPVEKKSQKKSKKVKKQNEIINHLLQDKFGRQIFLKQFSNGQDRYLLPDNIEIIKITRFDNIMCPPVIDTEFTDYIKKLEDITKEYLEENDNNFKNQYKRLKRRFKSVMSECVDKYRELNILDLASGKIKDIPTDVLHKLENCKMQRNQLISVQFKHALYDKADIFFNPRLKNFIEKHVGKDELYYNEDSGFLLLDWLKHIGFDVNINRKNPELPKKDFHKRFSCNEDGTKRPMCTFSIYAFFLLAELCKIFNNGKPKKEDDSLLDDILRGIRKRKIQMNRRISTGMMTKFYPNWLIEINGLTYKVALDFADTGALQGNISFSDNLKNLDMDTGAKSLMDDYKSNMLLGLAKHPKEWKEYALGDLSVYDVYKNYADLFKKLYEELNIVKFFSPPKMTIGGTVNNLMEGVLQNYLEAEEKNKSTLDELYNLTIYGSPKKIGTWTIKPNHDKEKDKVKVKNAGAKVAGGRCFLNKQVLLAVSGYTLCDIDISSAYTSIASSLQFYFGAPIIQSFKKHKVTLREFLNYYSKKIIKRGFKLIVETKELLKYEQDLLVSFPNLRFAKNKNFDSDGNLSSIDKTLKADNMDTLILTNELLNSHISYDDLNIILKSWNTEQREDFLDKVTMVCAVYYHKDYECSTIQELKDKQEEHDAKDNGKFKDAMDFSWIDNDDGDISHYWHGTNFGKLMMSDIIQQRRVNKKTNFTLSYLFKLVGNTVYGDSVSRHFNISNLVFASNITAMCRAAMWCVEKALDIHQTITDGGIFLLNEVLHKYGKRLDSSLLVRAYTKSKKEMTLNKKWRRKPINKNGKKIEYIEGKGWLCDDVIYPFVYDEVKPLEENYNNLKDELGEKNEKTKSAKKLLDDALKGLNDFIKKINQLALDHVKSQFPNVELFNGEFDKIKTDENGIGQKDWKGDYIYETVNGLLEFEVKNICDWSVFHGSADYMYNDTTNNITSKMRGYESKKGLVAVKLEDDKFIFDEDYYNEIPPARRFLFDIKNNPNNVSIPNPYIKSAILKINEYTKNYLRLWGNSYLFPGDTIFKFMTIPIYSMRHKFRTNKQHKGWVKCQNSLKRRTGGLSFEQFYLNDDGTIRYQDMLEDIDKHIREGVENPAKVFDKDNHFFRNMRLKKNQKKYQIILNHIKLTTTMKNTIRIMIIGPFEFCSENMKYEKNNIVYLKKTLKNISSDYINDYEDLNKYSFDYEFRDRELKLAI